MAKRTGRLTLGDIDFSINTPYLIKKNLSEARMRKEYTTLRDIAQKRLKVLEKAGETKSAFYKRWNNDFRDGVPKLKNVGKKELPYLLAELRGGIKSRSSTIKGLESQREQTSETLKSHGFDIPVDQLDDFGEYMKRYRDSKMDQVFASSIAVELYESVVRNAGKDNIDGYNATDLILKNWKQFYKDRKTIEKLDDANKQTYIQNTLKDIAYQLNEG